MTGRRGGDVALRLIVAHALAYPVAIAWAFGAVPFLVIAMASAVGASLDDAVLAHRVLARVLWPTVASFLAVHVAGVRWALAGDAPGPRRAFVIATGALGALAVVGGGGAWLWLMTM